MDYLTILIKMRGNTKDVELYGIENGKEVVWDVAECPTRLYEGSLFLFEGWMYKVVGEFGANVDGYDQAYKFDCKRVYNENLEWLSVVDN